MSTVMLKLPMTSVLLATLLLTADGLTVMPLVIVAVVVAYVTAARLEPAPPARHIAPSTVPTATGTPPAVEPGKALPPTPSALTSYVHQVGDTPSDLPRLAVAAPSLALYIGRDQGRGAGGRSG